jgi:3-oxoacyl-[acyl-carrier protein] reductase
MTASEGTPTTPVRSSRPVAIVTGGSRGIGAAICRRLAADGFDVALSYRSGQEQAEAVAAECRAAGAQTLTVRADAGSSEDCAAFVSAVLATFGRIDALVSNAGITRDGLAMRMSDDQFDAVVSVNLKGAFVMARQVLPAMMKARSGRIVNISSVAGVYGNAGQANYSAAKAGLIGLTLSLSKEVGSRGITVNAVAPGFIETDMTAALNEKMREAVLPRISLGRFGNPEDVAGAVSFLVSADASYLTGQTIVVSGGLSL